MNWMHSQYTSLNSSSDGGLVISNIEMICNHRSMTYPWLTIEELTNILIDTGLRKESQQLQLSQCSKAEQRVVKRQDLFDGHLSASGFMWCGYHCSICSFTQTVQDLVVGTLKADLAQGICKTIVCYSPTSNRGRGFATFTLNAGAATILMRNQILLGCQDFCTSHLLDRKMGTL